MVILSMSDRIFCRIFSIEKNITGFEILNNMEHMPSISLIATNNGN